MKGVKKPRSIYSTGLFVKCLLPDYSGFGGIFRGFELQLDFVLVVDIHHDMTTVSQTAK